MTAKQRVLLAALGLGAGFLSGFLGIGGGLVLVPVLMLGFRQPIKRAVGTSLAVIVLVSLVGVATEWTVKGSNIRWDIGLVLALGSLLGSWAGGWILPRLPDRPLRLAFVLFVLLAAYRMLTTAAANEGTGLLPFAAGVVSYPVASVVGSLAGVTSVLFGVGGGLVTVPALSLLFQDVPFHMARATSLVTIVPTSGLGAYQHARMGTVDVDLARHLIPAALAGAVLGVVSVNLLPPSPCRLAFGVFLIVVALRLLAPPARVGWPLRRTRGTMA